MKDRYTRTELAAALGVSTHTLPKWILAGRLPEPVRAEFVGQPDYWPAEVIADYLPGGPKAPGKMMPGRRLARAEVSA